MKQSRIGLGVVTMLSIFVVVCMCVLVLFSSNKVYQKHIIPATTPGIPYLMEVHGHHGSHPDRTHMHRQQTRRRTVVL